MYCDIKLVTNPTYSGNWYCVKIYPTLNQS
jgi:hypothetical protein